MLRLSKKTDYALIALKHLVGRPDRTASAREIAEQYDIPVELLAKILQRLVRNGLLSSHQGIHGGYALGRPADRISVADVVQAIDGPMLLTACSEDESGCDQYAKCSVRDPLWRIKDRIVHALQACSLLELAADAATEVSPAPAPLAVRRGDGRASSQPRLKSPKMPAS